MSFFIYHELTKVTSFGGQELCLRERFTLNIAYACVFIMMIFSTFDLNETLKVALFLFFVKTSILYTIKIYTELNSFLQYEEKKKTFCSF